MPKKQPRSSRRSTTSALAARVTPTKKKSRSSRASAQAPADAVGDLHHEHQRADTLHAEIDRLFAAWLILHALSPDQQHQLRAATAELEQLYAGHIDVEEQVVSPAAAQLLSHQE